VGLNALKSLNLTNDKNNKVKSKTLELFELTGKKNSFGSSFILENPQIQHNF
jgi:hypothetical protein